MRPSWDIVWMETADAIALRSLCSRAQVGAVIVDANNIVRAASYNGPPPQFNHHDQECVNWCSRATADTLSPTYEDCWSTHAEMSAIARADRSTLAGATIYVTTAMCMPCAKVIPQTGITRVVHRVEEDSLHRDPDQVEAFLLSVGITVNRMVDTPSAVQYSINSVDTSYLAELAASLIDATCSEECSHSECDSMQRATQEILNYIDLATKLGIEA